MNIARCADWLERVLQCCRAAGLHSVVCWSWRWKFLLMGNLQFRDLFIITAYGNDLCVRTEIMKNEAEDEQRFHSVICNL